MPFRIRLRRGTQSQLDAAKNNSQLLQGELYHVTDNPTCPVWVGTGVNTMLPLLALASARVFTSSGNWTVPSGVTSITILAVGGGGGGGGASVGKGEEAYRAGNGGNGGSIVITTATVVGGDTISVTIGSGGSGSPGVGGGTGGTTTVVKNSFVTLASAGGGAGGGTSGGLAGCPYRTGFLHAIDGRSGLFGYGGRGAALVSKKGSRNGEAGYGYGSGGGGGVACNDGSGVSYGGSGGAGTSGIVIIWY